MDTAKPTSELAADVRDGLYLVPHRTMHQIDKRRDALAALDALVARVTDLEAQVRDVAQLAQGYEAAQRMEQERAEAAEAQVAADERKINRLEKDWQDLQRANDKLRDENRRLRAAESEEPA